MATRTWARLFSPAAAVALCAALAGPAEAVPTSVSYVGSLRTAAGPVNGQVNVSVTLWNAANGGSAVWGPQAWEGHTVSNGVLRLNIGGAAMPSLDGALQGNTQLWAQFTVNGDALGGRQPLTAAPFAIISENSERLGGLPASAYATNAAFAAAATAASHGSTAPASPAAGQLWFNTSDQTLYAWDSGTTAWVGVSVGDAAPEDLPTNGVENLSSGMLTNTFSNISHLWAPVGGLQIADANVAGPGTPTVANLQVTEATGGYITGLTVFTNFNLTSANNIQMRLIPPAGMGNSITLRDGQVAFGTYGEVWNITNTPVLAGLLDKNPSGTWSLVVQDFDNNLANPGVAGNLNSFEIRYDIVRSDHINANGLLETNTVEVSQDITDDSWSDMEHTGSIRIKGDLKSSGEFIRKIQRFKYRLQELRNTTTGILDGRTRMFKKYRDDSMVKFTWVDNVYPNAAGSTIDFEIRVNGLNCGLPRPMRYVHRVQTTEARNYMTYTWVGYCSRLAGATSDLPAGEHEVSLWVSNNGYRFGNSGDATGYMIIEEIF